jgi:predicted ATP-grasp superfamily ATP-dependent carboligase
MVDLVTRSTTMPSASSVPALLTRTHFMGSLAAARCLAAHGVPVVAATEERLAPATWSRHVARRVRCPAVGADPKPYLEWLLAFGEREPGMVLYPASDDLAWLVARHADELSRSYLLFTPSADTMRTLLDKRALYEAASAAGIDVPATWYPRTEGELRTIAKQRLPLVLKPRSQVFAPHGDKGGLARTEGELVGIFRALDQAGCRPRAGIDVPGNDYPMVQEYLHGAAQGVVSVSGFVDRSGELLAARAARKVLQQASGLGVGVCCEAAPLPEDVVARLSAMFRAVGYFGVVEVELVYQGERRVLIDLNPRYFGQMGFDVARGSELPWLAHLSALGREDEACRAARAPQPPSPRVYRHGIVLGFRLASAGLLGALSRDDLRRWRRWLAEHRADAVDATLSLEDPGPAVAASLDVVWGAVRHARSFLRSLGHDGGLHVAEEVARTR